MTQLKTPQGIRLQNTIRNYREDPQRWGLKRGLTQEMAADRIGISHVWWRQVEGGGAKGASAACLASMCATLGIPSSEIREIGFPEIADRMDARIVGSVNGNGKDHGLYDEDERLEQYLRHAPGLTRTETEALVAVLRTIRHAPREEAQALISAVRALRHATEPFSADIWQHSHTA